MTCFICRKGFAGTPGYLSPEVLRKDPYGKPVDIWACGESSLSLRLVFLISDVFYGRERSCLLSLCQVLFSTSCWWDILHSGMKISTNCISRLKLEPMT